VELKEIAAILLCIVLNSIAQILLKLGMSNISKSISSISIGSIPVLISNIYVLFGGILYGTSFIIWLYVLSKVKLSYAYPFISLSYIIVAVLGLIILKESISPVTWAGILLVVAGVTLIGMNGGN
jgi:uncharacterized membrane protein